MLLLVFVWAVAAASELPLAPYTVKLSCRVGRRFGRSARSAVDCPSAATSCGYIQFHAPDVQLGIQQVGIFECLDNGVIMHEDDDEEENSKISFDSLCGAIPKCTNISLDTLNPAFLKYLITTHGIQLEELTSKTLRVCCSIHHNTLTRLVNSGRDAIPSVSSTPVVCGSEVCDAGAVGCLLHRPGRDNAVGVGSEEEYYEEGEEGEYEDEDEELENEYGRIVKKGKGGKGRKKRVIEEENDDDYQVNAVDIDWDDYEGEEYDRRSGELSDKDMQKSEEEEGEEPTKPSKSLAAYKVTKAPPRLLPPEPATTAVVHTTHNTPTTTGNSRDKYVYLDDGDDEEDVEEDTYCVYKHLNDEMYRYCLLIHSERDGDRCYRHKGHTVCCCFVPPDKETCDPLELDIIVPHTTPATIMPIRITAPPATEKAESSVTTTTSSSTTTSTTTTSITTTTEAPTTTTSTTTTTTTTTAPPLVVNNGCRVSIPRKTGKHGSKARPTLICSACRGHALFFSFFAILLLI